MMLEGKKALITGGSAGIGKAIAHTFVEQGAQVILYDINEKIGEQTALELCELAGNAHAATFSVVDVSSYEAVHMAVEKTLNDVSSIDILVNNAGITRDSLLMKMSEQQWNDVLRVNLTSVYNMCHALVRPMMKARSGKMINIASVIGLIGNAGQANYAASKAGVIGLTKSLARELASRSICVNGIAPGYINTKMTENLSEEIKESVISKVPMGRMGEPNDVANAALFLASSLSDYVTGQVIVVDGGMVM